MKIQSILNALDNVVFGKLSYRLLVTIVSGIFATVIGMMMLCLGLKRQYLEISAFLLPIPALVIVCTTFEFLKGKMLVSKKYNQYLRKGMKRKKSAMNSEWFGIGAFFVIAGLVFIIAVIVSPTQTMRISEPMVTKDQAILPEMEETVTVTKPPPPPPSRREVPTTTTTRRESPTPRPQRQTTYTYRPVATRDYTPSPRPGSSVPGLKIMGSSGAFRGGPGEAGSTPDEGEGFADLWIPPFAESGVNPYVVRGQKTQVIITRLKHSISDYSVYDVSLSKLEEALNENNPEMRFSIYKQQSFSPYGTILLMIGEDPQLPSIGNRVIDGSDSLRDFFTKEERKQLKTYIENGGILLVMEAIPFGGEGGFSKIVEKELKKILFESELKNPSIFFAEDSLQEFNQTNNYDSLAKVLTATLGTKIN